MPNSYPHDRIFNPHLTTIKDFYSLNWVHVILYNLLFLGSNDIYVKKTNGKEQQTSKMYDSSDLTSASVCGLFEIATTSFKGYCAKDIIITQLQDISCNIIRTARKSMHMMC